MVHIFEILLTALGLSMDACAAAIALGIKHREMPKLLMAAFFFAIFQAAMPLIGYFLGLPFENIIQPVDHWVAFFLLGALGVNMIFDFSEEKEQTESKRPLTLKLILALSFATSVDAFVIGVGIHALQWDLTLSILCIGLVTLVFSLLGIFVGRYLKVSSSDWFEKFGGVILIALGIKILISHLFL